MARRKKKPSKASRQKIAGAQHRNEFIKRLKQFLDKATGTQTYKLIPQYHIDNLYVQRIRSPRVKAAAGHKIPQRIIKYSQGLVTSMCKMHTVPINPIGEIHEISLYDYFSVCNTLISFHKYLSEDAFPGAQQVKKALDVISPLGDMDFRDKVIFQNFNGITGLIYLFHSDISENLYTVKYETSLVTGDIGYIAEIHCFQNTKTQISIDGAVRPAYLMGYAIAYPEPKLDIISIPSEEVFLQKGFMLDVYIQQHALDRLDERLDGADVGSSHYGIYESLKKFKVCKNKRGNLLFEYRYFGHKVGYFKGDISAGRIILRTFLFLTNNGTPEGEKLHANTGLLKEDKIYLVIDKLSTFVNSDIASHPRIKQLFLDAGCESLFNIDKDYFLGALHTPEKQMAAFITKHLKLDADVVPAESDEQ